MKRSIEETSGWMFIAGCLIMLALMVAPALAQDVSNLPIFCERADGLQANAAACTDAEQFQRPASANDVVLSCASATCDWYAPDLQWRKFSVVPDNYFVVVCPAARPIGLMNCPGVASYQPPQPFAPRYRELKGRENYQTRMAVQRIKGRELAAAANLEVAKVYIESDY